MIHILCVYVRVTVNAINAKKKEKTIQNTFASTQRTHSKSKFWQNHFHLTPQIAERLLSTLMVVNGECDDW